MAEPFDSHFVNAEPPGSIRVITRAATNIAAFVGRALKGPVNEPVPVRSFADYARVFGGLWQPSTLSYAVEQFFENGGRCAIIVRVVNGARPPTLTLPTLSSRSRNFAGTLVAALMAVIGGIPASTISLNSCAFLPCALTPVSVPNMIFTPALYAFAKVALICGPTSSAFGRTIGGKNVASCACW